MVQTTRAAILQPSYIPWLGYFEQILSVDHFIFLDDVQFDKGGWRNRNRIWLNGAEHWLTIPVLTSGRFKQSLLDVRISPADRWRRKHLLTLKQAYRAQPGTDKVVSELASLMDKSTESLVELTTQSIVSVARSLGATCSFHRASEFETSNDRVLRLIELCEAVQADVYISGQAARSYLNEDAFRYRGISVRWHRHDPSAYRSESEVYEPNLSYAHYACHMGMPSLAKMLESQLVE